MLHMRFFVGLLTSCVVCLVTTIVNYHEFGS
jgi:hypothetical protein